MAVAVDVLVGGAGVPVLVAVDVLVGGTGVSVAVAVAVGVLVGAAAQLVETVLESSVTAPLRAKILPATVAPVVRVIPVRARILPTNVVPVPSVAELPT